MVHGTALDGVPVLGRRLLHRIVGLQLAVIMGDLLLLMVRRLVLVLVLVLLLPTTGRKDAFIGHCMRLLTG